MTPPTATEPTIKDLINEGVDPKYVAFLVEELINRITELPDGELKKEVEQKVSTLKTLPDLEAHQRGEIRKTIADATSRLRDREDEYKDALDAIQKIDTVLQRVQTLLARLDKISFDPEESGLTLTSTVNNISQLQHIHPSHVDVFTRQLSLFSTKPDENEKLLKLHEELKQLVTQQVFQFPLARYKGFGTALSLFFTLYERIVKLFTLLKKDSEDIKKSKDIAALLNTHLYGLQSTCRQLLQSKEAIEREVAIVRQCILQILDSSKTDIAFLRQQLDESKQDQSNILAPPKRITHGYYLEAPSSKTFYSPKRIDDPTGVFTREESYARLFRDKPAFENEKTYGMDSPLTPLVDEYLDSGDSLITDFKGYKEELLHIAKQFPKLSADTKAVLILPCYQEEQAIDRTLRRYASCTDIDKVAIILLENLVAGTKRDNTLAKVELVRATHPTVSVYHLFKSFDRKMPIGYIRKYATELAILLRQQSDNKNNLIIVGGDADCVDIKKEFFTTIMEAFYGNPSLDAVELKMDFPVSYRMAYPSLWVMHRIFDYSWTYMRRKINPNQAIRMYGPASAIKASSYLMIKGFNPRTTLCEDLQLSWLLDEARRSAPAGPTYFDYLGKAMIVTNPRRVLGAYLSNIAFLDVYEKFTENDEIRNLGWEDLVAKKTDNTLNVGNTFDSNQIRDVIKSRFRSNEEKDRVKEITLSLAYGLQRYVDWWQFKVEQRKWLNLAEFDTMFERIMYWIGINYSINYEGEAWTITILNVSQLREHIRCILESVDPQRGNLNLSLTNYVQKAAQAPTQESAFLLMLGHTSGSQGEVTTAKKYAEITYKHKIPSRIVDIFDLISRPQEREKLTALSIINTEKSYRDELDMNPEDNPIAKEAERRLNIYTRNRDCVILYVTTPYNQLGLAKIGIPKKYPTIGWFYFYDVRIDNIYHPLLRDTTVITTYTPTGIDYLLANKVPEHKIVYIPITYPAMVDAIYTVKPDSKKQTFKETYLNKIAKSMNKKAQTNQKTIVFGVISRVVPMYNQVFILECFKKMKSKLSDVVLLIKSPEPSLHDPFGKKFLELAQELRGEPWFLWDKEFTTYESLFEIYQVIDAAIFMSGAGQAAVEQAALGVPLIVLDIPYNRTLYSDMSWYVKCDNYNNENAVGTPNENSFISTVKTLVSNKETISDMRTQVRTLAEKRFSPQLTYECLSLAMEAAKTYFYKKDDEQMRKKVKEHLQRARQSFAPLKR